jgi:hypothetical protein
MVNKSENKISRPEREVQYFKAGARVIYHLPSRRKSENMNNLKTINRGKITEYTPRTAFRLSLHLSEYGELYENEITLTYPDEFPMNGEKVREDRHAMIRKLRKHGMTEYTTCLEFQARGAPHIHIMLDKWIAKEWLKKTWSKIVCSGDPLHEIHGAAIYKITDMTKTKVYMSSYAKKKDQKKVPEGYENVGKWWTSNRSIKPHEIEKTEYKTEKHLMRENRNINRWRRSVKREVIKKMWMKNYKAWKIENGKGFFAWGENTKTIIARLKHENIIL